MFEAHWAGQLYFIITLGEVLDVNFWLDSRLGHGSVQTSRLFTTLVIVLGRNIYTRTEREP